VCVSVCLQIAKVSRKRKAPLRRSAATVVKQQCRHGDEAVEAAATLCSMKNRHQGLAALVTETVVTTVETENKTQHAPTVKTEDLHTKIDC